MLGVYSCPFARYIVYLAPVFPSCLHWIFITPLIWFCRAFFPRPPIRLADCSTRACVQPQRQWYQATTAGRLGLRCGTRYRPGKTGDSFSDWSSFIRTFSSWVPPFPPLPGMSAWSWSTSLSATRYMSRTVQSILGSTLSSAVDCHRKLSKYPWNIRAGPAY